MSYKKTTWVDGVVEKPRTYTETDNGDGTKTLNPEFGNVIQEGTPINAEKMNNIEKGIEDAHKEIDQSNIKINQVSASMADIANVIVATGTGTAITLSMPSITACTDNMKLTFIASADNGGGATTININGLGAKNLYKPNTTTAPNLKSGKPYTVWYNGTHFFLQASAEGNALAEHVLAGKTFSNDDDTGIAGTMDLNNLVSGNIKQGVDINGVIGTLKGLKIASGMFSVSVSSHVDKVITGINFKPIAVFIYESRGSNSYTITPSCLFEDLDTNYFRSDISGSYSSINGTIMTRVDTINPTTNNITFIINNNIDYGGNSLTANLAWTAIGY